MRPDRYVKIKSLSEDIWSANSFLVLSRNSDTHTFQLPKIESSYISEWQGVCNFVHDGCIKDHFLWKSILMHLFFIAFGEGYGACFMKEISEAVVVTQVVQVFTPREYSRNNRLRRNQRTSVCFFLFFHIAGKDIFVSYISFKSSIVEHVEGNDNHYVIYGFHDLVSK